MSIGKCSCPRVYVELGADHFNKFNTEKKINSCLKRLHALGWTSDQKEVQPKEEQTDVA